MLLQLYLFSILLGGMSLTDDMVKAKRCHIAVGTPGRIRALINAKNIDAKSTRLFVLDEADKLMESAFRWRGQKFALQT